jgi:hypothetical protein
MKWDTPSTWHLRAVAATPLRRFGRVVRWAGTISYPRLERIDARRADRAVEVDWQLGGGFLRGATQLLVTVHRAGDREVLERDVVRIRGRSGTARVAAPELPEGPLVVRASAYNRLRQRSDPLQAPLA